MTWIKTTDRLPKHGQRVLALKPGDEEPFITTFFTTKWITAAGATIKDMTDTYELWRPVPTRSGENNAE